MISVKCQNHGVAKVVKDVLAKNVKVVAWWMVAQVGSQIVQDISSVAELKCCPSTGS
jgi:hypothetical protein